MKSQVTPLARAKNLAFMAFLAASIAAVGCDSSSGRGSNQGPGPNAISQFQTEASSVDMHPFPNDDYMDRVFEPAPPQGFGQSLLATPTFRAAVLGAQGVPNPEAVRVGGFNTSQAGLINLGATPIPTIVQGGFAFLNQLSFTFQTGYSSTTPVRIPFARTPTTTDRDTVIIDVNSAFNTGAVRVFDLGNPAFDGNPATPPVLDGQAAIEVPIGEMRVSQITNSIIFRPTQPFAFGTPGLTNPSGLRTFGVVVTNGLRTIAGGGVSPSTQYSLIQATNGQPTTGIASLDKYAADTMQGFAKVSAATGLQRADTVVYFQFSVKRDIDQLRFIRDTINGDQPVAPITGNGDGTVTAVDGQGDGDDISVNPINAPTIITAATTPNIAQTFNAVFGPYSGTSTQILTQTDTIGNSTGSLVDANASFLPSSLTGGTLTVNGVNFPIIGNSAIAVQVLGNLSAAAGGQLVTYTATPSNGGGVAVPQLGIERIVMGTLLTPDFRADPVAAAIAAGQGQLDPVLAAQIGAPDFSRTFLSGGGIANGALFLPFSPDQGQGANPIASFGNTNMAPYVAFFPPAAAVPAAPVVLGLHGVSRQKEDLFALASAVCQSGQALIVIDYVQHGARQAQDGDFTNAVDANLGGFPDPFVNATLLARTRDKVRQSIADIISVSRAVNEVPNAVDPNGQIDPTRIRLIGQSLGGIIGTQVNTVDDRVQNAVLNVPGGSLLNIFDTSPTLAAQIDGLLLATANLDQDLSPQVFFSLLAGSPLRMAKNSGARETYNIAAQSIAGAADALTYGPAMLSNDPALNDRLSPASALVQNVGNDLVIPTPSNARLASSFAVGDPNFTAINLLGVNVQTPQGPTTVDLPLLFNVQAVNTQTVTANTPLVGVNGIIQFTGTHGFLFGSGGNLLSTAAGQTTAATFTATADIGGLIGNAPQSP